MTASEEERDESTLVARAADGDRTSLEELLLAHHAGLVAAMKRRISARYAGRISAEDVVQEAFTAAFRNIQLFESRGPDSFRIWLAALAEHRLQDMIKALEAAKRGGGRKRVASPADQDTSSVVDLLAMVATHSRTPSRSAAVHEAVSAVQRALDNISPQYREAILLRYLEGLPVKDIAARMERTERAVHMLCNRGLKQLQAALGNESDFLSRKV